MYITERFNFCEARKVCVYLWYLYHVPWTYLIRTAFIFIILQLKERKRIKKAGGFISFNGVWRVAGVLATSRALGDYPLKDKNFVIAEPDILAFELDTLGAQFMILATDGLWDAFSNEEAVKYVRERLDEPHYGAKSLVLQAYYRGSLDNITVMVVNFTNRSVAKVSRRVNNA